MSLFQGKYRRTRCTTKQPSKPGLYLAFYGEHEGPRMAVYWNGVSWNFGWERTHKTAFGNTGSKEELWSPIPKDEIDKWKDVI